ncbi:HAMP domain-containing sensor histidine kinase [Paenibacillus sp.]|uniref:sensor histidine kinase n=1 Tax=Paenibacillus sp. TaxID=58172 RepID=UPI0028127B51|nr:HAMP domain-containing sensor histidine kinase [Paenibacillus sp.]
MSKRTKRKLFAALATIALFATLAACGAGSYFLLRWIYGWTGPIATPWLNAIVHFLTGFFLFGTLMSAIRFAFRHGRDRPFLQMVEAIRRIARGDFGVRLPAELAEAYPGNPFVQLARSINDMAKELDETERMRRRFISDVSHEIQSPLTSIRGFARALRRDVAGREEAMRYLDVIEAESERLSRLSENLLKLASLESDVHPFEPKAYRLDRQLRSVVLACEPQWREKRIEMSADLPEATVVADEDLISQVWINLIGNAVKFTPSGGRVRISATWVGAGDDTAVRVSVADSGPGIPAAERELVFDRFYKIDKARLPGVPGSGLGLAIVKRIVEMHGGTVAVADAVPIIGGGRSAADEDRLPGAELIATIPASALRRDRSGE